VMTTSPCCIIYFEAVATDFTHIFCTREVWLQYPGKEQNTVAVYSLQCIDENEKHPPKQEATFIIKDATKSLLMYKNLERARQDREKNLNPQKTVTEVH